MKHILNLGMLFCCLSIMSFKGNINTNDLELNIKNLSKKWKLDKYSIGLFSEKPSRKEQNDYIELSSNMTFTSVSEGVFERGTWQLEKVEKKIILSKKEDKENLIFIIKNLTESELAIVINDSSDSDAKYLNIHFKN